MHAIHNKFIIIEIYNIISTKVNHPQI